MTATTQPGITLDAMIEHQQWHVDTGDNDELIAIEKAILASLIRLREIEGKSPDDGELWSWLRGVMLQGMDIHQDYMAGKYRDYEAYSCRVDCAASERADQLALLLRGKP